MSKYTKGYLAPLVQQASSIAEVVRLVKIKGSGGNHRYISSVVSKLELDTSHFSKSVAMRKSKIYVSPQELLVKGRKIYKTDAARLKRALLEVGRKYKCVKCPNHGNWNGEPISLEIDHINRDCLDNRPENLQFLCPNCHSQKTRKEYERKLKPSEINPEWRYRPRLNNRKVVRPTKEILENEIKTMSFVELGKRYGVSDNAVRKWCRYYCLIA